MTCEVPRSALPVPVLLDNLHCAVLGPQIYLVDRRVYIFASLSIGCFVL
jgi:hypothetical protein